MQKIHENKDKQYTVQITAQYRIGYYSNIKNFAENCYWKSTVLCKKLLEFLILNKNCGWNKLQSYVTRNNKESSHDYNKR